MQHIMIIGTNMMNIYNHRLELIKSLLSNGFYVSVVAPHGGEEIALEKLGVNFIDIPIDNRGTNIKKDLKLIFDLVKIIRKVKPDVVLTFYTKTNIYGGIACRLTSTPYIENITGLGSALSNKGFMQKVMLLLYKTAVGKASMIFFQNTHNRMFFKSHNIRKDTGILLPGSGVSLERYTLLPYPEDNVVTFSFISRILKEKGIVEYIAAAKYFKELNREAIFNVIGPCDESCIDIIKEAENKGYINYHDKVFDVHPFLQKTHCMIFPSFYAEGMANVLLESAASGRPVITTDMPGCKETVDDEVSGYIVTPQDSTDLIEKIENFLSLSYEEKKEMGIRGRKKMENEFNRDIITQAYLNEINKILR